MKKIPYLFLAFLFSCASSTNSEKPLKVHHKGAMKTMMHKGDISAKADLDDLKDKDHLYALGAVENLKGEVLILDGKKGTEHTHHKHKTSGLHGTRKEEDVEVLGFYSKNHHGLNPRPSSRGAAIINEMIHYTNRVIHQENRP